MTQDKMRRLITACVSACTVLLVCLLTFLIYQWIAIAKLNTKIAEAEEEVAYWTEKNENAETDLEFYESELYLKWALGELEALKGKQ